MDNKIKYFIGCSVPVYVCNFKCQYCYLGQCESSHKKEIVPFFADVDYITNIFMPEKLGGYCYFNFCASGETMMHPQVIEIVSKLSKQGHYVDIITNGTLEKKFDELIDILDDEQKQHVFIKFSFHYHELKKRNMLSRYIDNVNKVRNANISYSIEITPHDSLVKDIQEIKELSMREFGALPHITVARDESTSDIEILSQYTREEYTKIWSQFDSEMFNFKMETFNIKRCEFCYAGLWSIQLDLETGDYYQCYDGDKLGNLRSNESIVFKAIGKCRKAHCFNSHAFLTYGLIPELNCPTYAQMRDRVTTDGKHWVQEKALEFFSSKLQEEHTQLTEVEKNKIMKRSLINQKINTIRIQTTQMSRKIVKVLKNEK